MSRTTRVIRWTLCFLVAFGLVFLLETSCTIPPRDYTVTIIDVLRLRIEMYHEEHGYLPTGLDELPRLENRDNSTEDGWGRRILYLAEPNERVTLLSYGADGEEGGQGADRDIVGVFHIGQSGIDWEREPR